MLVIHTFEGSGFGSPCHAESGHSQLGKISLAIQCFSEEQKKVQFEKQRVTTDKGRVQERGEKKSVDLEQAWPCERGKKVDLEQANLVGASQTNINWTNEILNKRVQVGGE